MSNADYWLDTYTNSHQNSVNKVLHWVCVPVIVVGLVTGLWALPVPEAFTQISPVMNWGSLFLLASVVYYFVISIPLALGMVPIVFGLMALVIWLDRATPSLFGTSAMLFIVGCVGQFVGHLIEGRRPSFFSDAKYLMIGPLWLLAAAYRKLGIPY